MIVEIGKRYTNKQLRNKFNQLRALHKDFKKLLSKTSVGYNADSGMIIMEDKRWERLTKVLKYGKEIRNKGCKHFEKLSAIFGETHASGSQVHPSTRSHTTSHVPTNMAHINSLDDTMNEEGNDVEGKERTPSPEPRPRKVNKYSFASTMSVVMKTMIENSKRKAEAIEKAIAATSSNRVGSHEAGDCNSPTQREKEKGEVQNCIRVITYLEGLDTAHYNKALAMFHDSSL
ncbi:uncharacterized protein LOC132311539 [Cornus florida]|uniref:uncharacterized protein LOC132311539 n=1 Tax=Cornus florida TaxID=4283 RepID=UPI0028A2B508|nr:uncharacterized protein LOC132311539 [Cornus florida]